MTFGSPRRNRRRGLVLTPQGRKKLEVALQEAADQERGGRRLSIEEIAGRAGLDPGTTSKVLRSEKVDYRSLELLFRTFNLELAPTDITSPSPPIEPSVLQQQSLVDWGDAPEVSTFYGREADLDTLKRWVMEQRHRLVMISGIGGIGKTSLSVKLAEAVQSQFEYVIWRSLRNTPTRSELITDLIRVLSNQESTTFTLDVLQTHLRQHRCLILLDNIESLLQDGLELGDYPNVRPGYYRDEYSDYGELFEWAAMGRHKSCFVLAGRKRPDEFVILDRARFQVYQLGGLSESVSRNLVRDQAELEGSDRDWKILMQRYMGNPLMLRIVASNIQQFFGRNISHFLEKNSYIPRRIGDLLDEQFQCLSGLEQQVMYWLAIEQEPISARELHPNFEPPVEFTDLLVAIQDLQQRSLIESSEDGFFSLQPVVMEYVIGKLARQVCSEIMMQQPRLLQSHALMKAQTLDYARDFQIRTILTPLEDQLLTNLRSRPNIVAKMSSLLEVLQREPHLKVGYAAGNIINFLNYLRADLTGYDFSGLTVRQAYLVGTNLHQVDFSGADLKTSIFSEMLGPVSAVEFSPDGTLLATGDASGEVRLWRVSDGTLCLICQGHEDWVRSISFHPTEPIFVSGSGDYTLRIWNLHTGQCLKVCRGHGGRVRSVRFDRSGRWLASASADQTIRLWEVASRECVRVLEGHGDRVRSVDFGTDAQQRLILASGSEDRTIKLWEVATGTCLQTLTGHTDWVRSVAFCPEGELLASASADTTAKLWNIDTGLCVQTLEGHGDCIRAVRFSPDGKRLATASSDMIVRLWDTATGRHLQTLLGHSNWVRCIAFEPQGEVLASGSADRSVKLWNVDSGQCLQTVQGCARWVRSIAFSPDGTTLVSGSADHRLRLWDVATRKCVRTWHEQTNWIQSVAFSPDGHLIGSGSGDNTVRIWDSQTGHCLRHLEGHSRRVLSIAFRPDGQVLASSGDDRTIRLWDVATEECLRILKGHQGRVRSVTFSPDGNLLASAGEEEIVNLWDSTTGTCLQTLAGHTNRVRSVAFSPDGRWLASGSEDTTIRVWDVATGNCVATLEGHGGRVRSVAFNPVRGLLASGSADATVKLWDVQTWQCLHTFEEHTDQICSIVFSPDGNTLASGSRDESIRLWQVQKRGAGEVLRPENLYEGMTITGATGLTQAQKATLLALGAIAHD